MDEAVLIATPYQRTGFSKELLLILSAKEIGLP
jgi:hypothetical protein